MAPRKRVSSLQELCIRCISLNINIWCGKRNNQQPNKLSLTVDENPVSRLPNIILSDICTHVMREYSTLRPYHLNTVIHKYTVELDFSRNLSRSIACHGTDLICNICKNLTSLNLSQNTVFRLEVAQFIPLIEKLNLKSTATDDGVLLDLGNNCPNLRELDIRDSDITDLGLSALCTEDYVFDRKCHGRCRLIQKLFLRESDGVTDKGAETVILNLPELRDFDYLKSLRVIKTIHDRKHSNGCSADDQLKLENIRYGDPLAVNYDMDDMLDAALCLCPNLKKFEIMVGKDRDYKWLFKLANFSLLEELSLNSMFAIDEITFSNRIATTLHVIGNNLKSLSLRHVYTINLWDVGVCCPQLLRLEICYAVWYSTTIPRGTTMSTSLFGQLREVVIRCRKQHDTPREQLQTLLTNCSHLQVLSIEGCDTLTDDLLSRVFEYNKFFKLRAFTVKSCKNIRMSSIFYLLTISSTLTEISCSKCARIENSDFVELQNLIRRENLEVTLTCCTCSDVTHIICKHCKEKTNFFHQCVNHRCIDYQSSRYWQKSD